MKQVIFLLLCLHNISFAQVSRADSFYLIKYNESFNSLDSLLTANGSFKTAVFITDQTFSINTINEAAYNQNIAFLKNLCSGFYKSISDKYHWRDSINNTKNLSVFSVIADTTYILSDKSLKGFLPFHYNFSDPQGNQDFTNTFVTKLLATHKGNCRSLTYLYKILADELGAKCWLALAPNHIYIRNYSKQIGWYNTELTSGTFPTDAWIAATGYVSTDAIRSGVYMDTLSNQQSIGLCILDLAQGYLKQTNNYTDGFVLKCCNLVLQYHAVNPEALLIKAEALKHTYLKEKEDNNPNAPATYNEMQQTYISLVKLGYREMPYKTYQQWLKSMRQDEEKYINKKLKASLNN